MSLRGGYYFRDNYTEGVYDGDLVQYFGSSVGVPGVPAEWQKLSGYQNVTTNSARLLDKQKRFQIQYDTTFFFSGAGEHQLKAGVQMDQIGLDQLTGEQGNRLQIRWNQALAGQRGAFGYYQLGSNNVLPNLGTITQGEATVNNLGLFVQDAWTIGGRLTLHLGLRTENEHVPSLLDDPRAPGHREWSFRSATSWPRGWASPGTPTGDGKTKVYGSWGVFYDITKLELTLGVRGHQGGSDTGTRSTPATSRWRSSTTRAARMPREPHPGPARLRRRLERPRRHNRVNPGVKQMRMQEAVLGVEREIAPNLSVSARCVHKRLVRAIDDTGPSTRVRTSSTRSATPAKADGDRYTFSPGSGTVPTCRRRSATTTRSSSPSTSGCPTTGRARQYPWGRL